MKKTQNAIMKSIQEWVNYRKSQSFLVLLFLTLLMTGNGYAQNPKSDWLDGEYPESFGMDKIGNTTLTIEYENFPLYVFRENKIRISSSDKNANYKILLPNEKPIEFKGSHIVIFKPMSCSMDKIYLISGKDTISRWFSVTAMPNPTLFFDTTNQYILLRDEIYTTKLQATIKRKPCKILKYKLVILRDEANGYGYASYGTTITNQDTTFTNQNRSRIASLKDGDNFYLTDVLVEMPDGSKRVINNQKFKLIKYKYQRNYCKYLEFDKSPFITKSYCDLRVKIETDSLKSKTKILESFFEELNQEMNGIKVKLVNILPDITFSDDKYLYSSNTSNNFFYPDIINTNEYKITFKRIWSFEGNDYQREEVDADKFIEIILKQIGIEYNKSTVIKDSLGFYHLTPLSKEHLNALYSNGSINKIYKELNEANPKDSGKDYTLIIVILSFILFLVLRELIQSFAATRNFFIHKTSWWKQLLSYVLVAQIPLMIFLLIQHLNEVKITWAYLITAEKYYLIFAVLVGIMLWGLDKLQNHIKYFALRLLLDFVLTLVIFWAAYQLIFIATHLDYVRVDMLRWQWIYIPLMVAIYRIYSLYNQRKIDQLLQEKELEISKQKELTTKAELLALQSRINPHFLYNSLNSIASLATIDTQKTEQMAVNLAKLFRYNLNKGEDLITTVEQELEMTKLYLDIEKQRFGDRLDYQVEVPEELMTFQIPIFLLQPLVENAIKHGVSKITEPGVIKINIEKIDKSLLIKVYDNGPAFNDEPIHGYGLQNIFDKLTLIYKNNYTIRFVNEPEKHIEIRIGIGKK